tara:strand:+ start:799 stop:2820 length:2022 start_codon:yes stop_codon:yes gene_type:complete
VNIEVSSVAVLVSVFAALLVSFFFYFRDESFKESASWIKYTISACRFFIVFILVFLLFSPFLTLTKKEIKRPIFPILVDNTKSIDLADSSFKNNIGNFISKISEEINRADVKVLSFSDHIEIGKDFTFDNQGTNISKSINQLNESFLNENIGAALLISDGINTEGLSLYKNLIYPIFTLGIGDSVKEPDAKIKKMYFNNIVFVNNIFVVESQFQFDNLIGIPQEIVMKFDGKKVGRVKYVPKSNNDFFKLNFKVQAKSGGVFPIDIDVKNQKDEQFLGNNSLRRFITVKSKKLKILIVSDEPHPDVRAIKTAFWGVDDIEILETSFSKKVSLELVNVVLLIGNSSTTNKRNWLNLIKKKKKGFIWFTGTQSAYNNEFFKFIRLDQSNDEIMMKSNPSFSLFKVQNEIKEAFENSTPISVPFGQWKFKGDVQSLMLQKIKNVQTDYSQIVFSDSDEINYSIYLGSGYWRIAMRSPDAFHKLLRKTVDFVSTKADNSQFRIKILSEFTDMEEVIIGAEFYNKLGELDNIGDITVSLIQNDSLILNSELQKTRKKYRYNFGRLLPGAYVIKAKYKNGNKEIIKKSSFIVNKISVEAENLYLNYEFLSGLSDNSGGEYFDWKNRGLVIKTLNSSKLFRNISYFELVYDLLLKYKWIFYILISLVTIEWILRKWQGVI